ncbi:dihydrofolate reductase family protein [Nakamurella leprariae]|uniref:Dihydrofolate reductase family protein n=1 Tax=Nakamurella leprariae TaxID=2803911 RepID=A0A938YF04_9ACTN|nr:dihydrofolate reductase family protein [Nakamurella leprariae]MBM9467212.1 dihydrofolate reductase family protein [Nakamurella leprariae]
MLAQQWVSVDGFAAGPNGGQDLFEAIDDPAPSERANIALLRDVDVVLLGRRTYETFSSFWPTATGEPMAEYVNAVPKVVASRTLTAAPWGDRPPAAVTSDAAAWLRSVKIQPGGAVLVWGSLVLMRSLLTAGLIDQLELLVAPIALGRGTPLVDPDRPVRLDLLEGQVWESGTARLRYRVRRPD